MALIGKIASRICPHCGHHEVGLMTPEGVFHPLRPGMAAQILDDTHVYTPFDTTPKTGTPTHYRPWAPDPVRGDRTLRLKYGVMVGQSSAPLQMDLDIYRNAYLDKLHHLIERDTHTPLAVLLDRFFTAPHLASGNPREIVMNMWQALEEIRDPFIRVQSWLENQNEANLIKLIHPKKDTELVGHPISDAELGEELEQLTLEEFFSFL